MKKVLIAVAIAYAGADTCAGGICLETARDESTMLQVQNLDDRKSDATALAGENLILAERTIEKYSDQGQDEWVLQQHPGPGVFLDIGARDGDFFSNTRKLEQSGWRGTCIEPFPSNFEKYHRTCNMMKVALVGKKKNPTRMFSNCEDGSGFTGLSGFADVNKNQKAKTCTQVPVAQMAVAELQAAVPKILDFVSLDIEGAELEILQAWDATKTCARLWAVEAEGDARAQVLEAFRRIPGCTTDVSGMATLRIPSSLEPDVLVKCNCLAEEVAHAPRP